MYKPRLGHYCKASPYTRTSFPWHCWQVPWYSFTCWCVQWTSFSLQVFLDKLYLLVCTTRQVLSPVMPAFEQSSLSRKDLSIYTALHTSKWNLSRENLSRKTCNLCCTRANKTCQGKTWSCVQGLSYMIYFECEFRRQQWRSSSTCKYDSEEKMRSMNKTWAWQSIFVWYIYRDG